MEKNENLQYAFEEIKAKFGDKKLALGSCKMINRSWVMNRENLTRDYFSWDGMLTIGD